MRTKILLSISLFSSLVSLAQNKPNSAFAIVGNANGRMNWTNIQEIDLTTGAVIRNVFEEKTTSFVLLDAKTRKKINSTEDLKLTNKLSVVKSGISIKATNQSTPSREDRLQRFAYLHPTSGMVAAAAYDARHNKLFFTPMHYAELRWIDLYDKSQTLQVYCLANTMLANIQPGKENEQFTRMVIAADGNGYALSNDANQFVRFTTGKSTEVSFLGNIKDDAANKEHSIHNRNMYGGDMIADAFGNLLLITANASVFKIEIKSMEAVYVGAIKGLPANYTTNGAVIDANGQLIVSSANLASGYFRVDLTTLQAEKFRDAIQPISSDLASGNLAFAREAEELSKAELRNLNMGLRNNSISVFPNPATNGSFRVNFNTDKTGQYDITLVDLSGKIVLQKRVTVAMKNQTERVAVDARLPKGLYNVKISSGSRKQVSAQHIILQ